LCMTDSPLIYVPVVGEYGHTLLPVTSPIRIVIWR
jgi:hypothetical protein